MYNSKFSLIQLLSLSHIWVKLFSPLKSLVFIEESLIFLEIILSFILINTYTVEITTLRPGRGRDRVVFFRVFFFKKFEILKKKILRVDHIIDSTYSSSSSNELINDLKIKYSIGYIGYK